MTQKTHSKIGASGAYRWFECPGSVALIGKAPPAKTSEYAAEGTAAHELGEKCLAMKTDADEYIGHVFNGFEVDQEMADAVQVYLDTCRQYMKPHCIVRFEEPFHLDWIHPDLYGTNDFLSGEPYGELVVIDYKHGRGVPVEVKDNKQLLYYAVGALRLGEFASVRLVVVQPRCAHTDGPVREHVYAAEEVETWAQKELLPAALRTFELDAKLQSGDHCGFCPAQAICPALRKTALETAIRDFSDDEFMTKPASDLYLPRPEELREGELRRILDAADMIDSWIREVKAYAEDMAKSGERIEGYKLVRKKSNRVWKSEDVAEAELKKEFGDLIYTEPGLLSIAQLEKKVGKANHKKLEPYWEKPEGGLTLVPNTDTRPEVTSNPGADFMDDPV